MQKYDNSSISITERINSLLKLSIDQVKITININKYIEISFYKKSTVQISEKNKLL